MPSDANTDGSYAHRECLYREALWPIARSSGGKNLYNHPKPEETK